MCGCVSHIPFELEDFIAKPCGAKAQRLFLTTKTPHRQASPSLCVLHTRAQSRHCMQAGSYLDDFFVRLIINLHGGCGLFYIPQYHVQMLVKSLGCKVQVYGVYRCQSSFAGWCALYVAMNRTKHGIKRGSCSCRDAPPVAHMQLPSQLSFSPQLDIYPFIQAELNQIQGLLDSCT